MEEEGGRTYVDDSDSEFEIMDDSDADSSYLNRSEISDTCDSEVDGNDSVSGSVTSDSGGSG